MKSKNEDPKEPTKRPRDDEAGDRSAEYILIELGELKPDEKRETAGKSQ